MTFTYLILSVAKTIGVPGAILLAICTQESNLKNVMVKHDNGSPSYGLCQVKYDTAKILGFTGNSDDLMNPETNVTYAALYLKMQLSRYDGNLCKAVSAYNAGTYNPSTKSPGKPRNFKYIKLVISRLEEENKNDLTCD